MYSSLQHWPKKILIEVGLLTAKGEWWLLFYVVYSALRPSFKVTTLLLMMHAAADWPQPFERSWSWCFQPWLAGKGSTEIKQLQQIPCKKLKTVNKTRTREKRRFGLRGDQIGSVSMPSAIREGPSAENCCGAFQCDVCASSKHSSSHRVASSNLMFPGSTLRPWPERPRRRNLASKWPILQLLERTRSWNWV